MKPSTFFYRKKIQRKQKFNLFINRVHSLYRHRQANFRTAANGIVTLFRIVTGEDWNKVMIGNY